MTRLLSAILFLCIPVVLSLQPHLLQSQVTPEEIESSLLTSGEWRPFPTIEDREAWENLSTQIREHISSNGEEVSDYSWPILSAGLFLDYARTGTRTNYRKVYAARRNNLCKLVLAECLEAQGKYLDQIVNGIWAVCEESTWMVPAHVTYFNDPVGLPNVEQPRVDLFSAETGAMLSWIDYLLGKKLDEVSPLVRIRLKYEVKTRILDVNFEHTDFRWMGYNKSIRRPNNWNPWICANWLKCILLSDDTRQSKARQIYKLLEVLDNYVDPHPKDGGCDEGHNYWDRAAGCLFDVFDMLSGVSQGKIDFFDEPLIKNMGRYLYSMFIDGRYFVNFADSRAIGYSEPTLVYRFEQKIGDDNLKIFGAYMFERKDLSLSYPDLFWCLNSIFLFNEIEGVDANLPYTRDTYFPDIQIMTARSEGGSANGFFISAKGGHNDESHILSLKAKKGD